MRHARADYSRIQDPSGQIPEWEPVFLLRGQDKLAWFVTLVYASLYDFLGGDPEIVNHLRHHAAEMRAFAKDRMPTIPKP